MLTDPMTKAKELSPITIGFYKKALAVDVWALEPRYNICFAYLELGLAEQALSGLREYLIIKRILFWSKLLFIVSLLGLIAMAAYLKFAG